MLECFLQWKINIWRSPKPHTLEICFRDLLFQCLNLIRMSLELAICKQKHVVCLRSGEICHHSFSPAVLETSIVAIFLSVFENIQSAPVNTISMYYIWKQVQVGYQELILIRVRVGLYHVKRPPKTLTSLTKWSTRQMHNILLPNHQMLRVVRCSCILLSTQW